MSRWREIFDVDIGRAEPVPIYLWTGPSVSPPSGTDYPGLPGAPDIYDAPNFTLFLSPAGIAGELPTGEELEDDPDQDVWVVSYLPTTHGVETEKVVQAIPIPFPRGSTSPRSLGWLVEIRDEVRGDEIDFRGWDMTLDDDLQAVPYAMDRGYSFLKVPDVLEGDGSQYFHLHIVDEVIDDGRAFRQPGWQKQLLAGKAGPVFDQKDVDTINQHRAAAGRPPIDLAVGWTPAELADMARNIRKHGREYNTGMLKRRLIRR